MAAGGAALTGLLHATAAGAVVLAGMALAIPDAVVADNALEAAADAVAFGLASLRVPLESGGVQGTFAPLSGLLLTLWGLASAVRRVRHTVGRARCVGATGAAFSLACLGGAAAAGSLASIRPSLPWAALMGFAWGSLGAALGTYGEAEGAAAESDIAAGRAATRGRRASVTRSPGPRLRRLSTPPGPPWLAPGLFVVLVAFALGTVPFFVAVVAGVVGSPAREVAGGVLLAVSVAPNAAAALVALGLGSSVDVVLGGTLLAEPLRGSLSLWDGPLYVLVLAVVPAVAAFAGGRVAAVTAPEAPAIVRGLRNGTVFGAALVAAGWAGSLAATAGAAGDQVSVRLGFSSPAGVALAVAWGVAGACLGPRLPRPGRGSRVEGP